MTRKNHMKAIEVLAKSELLGNARDAYFFEFLNKDEDKIHKYVRVPEDGITTYLRTDEFKTEILLAARGMARWAIQKTPEGVYGILGSVVVTASTDEKEIELKINRLRDSFSSQHEGIKVDHYAMPFLVPGDVCVTISHPKRPDGGCDVSMGQMDYMLTETAMFFPKTVAKPASAISIADAITLRREEAASSIVNRLLLGIDGLRRKRE